MKYGKTLYAYQRSGFTGTVKTIISGLPTPRDWGLTGRAGRVPRYFLIREATSAANGKSANRPVTVTGLWKYGISCLPHINPRKTARWSLCRTRTWTPAWDWRGWGPVYRGGDPSS